MQGADEGRSREKVSWASVNAADTSLEVRDEVAASSRAELKEVVMSSAEQRNHIVLYAKTGCRPSLGEFALCGGCARQLRQNIRMRH
jgi:hypothetical protein